MGLSMHLTPGGGAPMVVCDHCNEHVRDAGLATCYWERGDAGSDSQVFIVHKTCYPGFDDARDAHTWPTMELRHFLVLGDNLSITLNDWMAARDSADRMRGL